MTAPASPARTEGAGRAASSAILPLLAIIATAVNLRTAVTGFSPLLEIIGDDLGFGPALYGLFGTIVTASFAVFGFVAAAVSRRWGLEVTIAAATLLTAVGVLTRALAPNPTTLVLSTIVAFAGVGTSNVLIVPLVKRYFADRIKAISSLYLALLQLGQFVAPLVAVPVAVGWGWRPAIGVWAAISAVACVLWAVVALRSRRSAASGGAAAATATGAPIEGAWRSPLLWGLVAMFAMTALNTYVVITWLPTILVDAGADPALGGTLLALFSVFGLLAAFVVPPLAVKLRNPIAVVVVCVALLGVGYAGLMVAPLEGAVVWVVALGLGVSTFPLCLTLVNARSRTTAGSSRLSSAMQGIGYGIACVGPLGIGLLYDATGGWGAPYAVLFLSLAILLVGGILACRPGAIEDSARGARAAS
jgi:CP family cyanate transporter-like MFS transporter